MKKINVDHVNVKEMERRLIDNDWTPNGFNPITGWVENRNSINPYPKKYESVKDKVDDLVKSGEEVEVIAEKVHRHPSSVKRIMSKLGVTNIPKKTFKNYTPAWMNDAIEEYESGKVTLKEIARRVQMPISELKIMFEKQARKEGWNVEYTETQIKVYNLIKTADREMPIAYISDALNVAPVTVSKAIRFLKERGVLRGQRGTWEIVGEME